MFIEFILAREHSAEQVVTPLGRGQSGNLGSTAEVLKRPAAPSCPLGHAEIEP